MDDLPRASDAEWSDFYAFVVADWIISLYLLARKNVVEFRFLLCGATMITRVSTKLGLLSSHS
jgi:hypothetical protein